MSKRPRWLVLTLQLFIFAGALYLLWQTSGTDDEPPVIDKTPGYRQSVQDDAAAIAGMLNPESVGIKDWMALEPVFRRSQAYLKYRPADKVAIDRPGLKVTWGQLKESVDALLEILPKLNGNPQLLAEHFNWYHLAPETLLTGYFELTMEASLVRTKNYRYPLYELPGDLKTIKLEKFHPRWKGHTLVYRHGENGIEPYHDRIAIDRHGKLAGQGHEIAWAKNPIDIFFLQIQGSGRLVLPDGSTRNILYAGKNGHPYVSVGRLLIESGAIPKDKMSMGAIKDYFVRHPEEAKKIMEQNPSYVFFKLADKGPYGSMGKILTPMASVAVDRSWIPLGAVMALKSTLPVDKYESRKFATLVSAQDTGGAIQGTDCDFFTGHGKLATMYASKLQNKADIWILLKKQED